MTLYPDQNFHWLHIGGYHRETQSYSRIASWQIFQYSLSNVDKKLIFRWGKLDQIQQLGGGVQNCIYSVFGGYITQHCEHILFSYTKMNAAFVGGNHLMWCWNYSSTNCILSREVIGVTSIACIKIYVPSGSCWVIYSTRCFMLMVDWHNLHQPFFFFLPWTVRCSSFWIYTCKTFSHLGVIFF